MAFGKYTGHKSRPCSTGSLSVNEDKLEAVSGAPRVTDSLAGALTPITGSPDIRCSNLRIYFSERYPASIPTNALLKKMNDYAQRNLLTSAEEVAQIVATRPNKKSCGLDGYTRIKCMLYKLYIRLILIYAAPVWCRLPAVSAHQMERFRIFKRSCPRSAANIRRPRGQFKLVRIGSIYALTDLLREITSDFSLKLSPVQIPKSARLLTDLLPAPTHQSTTFVTYTNVGFWSQTTKCCFSINGIAAMDWHIISVRSLAGSRCDALIAYTGLTHLSFSINTLILLLLFLFAI